MKFSLSTLFVVLPLLAAQVSALAVPRADELAAKGGSRKSGGKAAAAGGAGAAAAAAGAAAAAKAKGNKGGASSSAGASGSVTSSATSAASTSTSTAAASSNNSSDAQTSLTLDPAVIAQGFAQNGQATQEPGQVASLTSTNNFINFCATTNQPLTNGQQVKTGSCNPAPMGQIPSTSAMPSAKFTFPKNLDNIENENTAFTVTLAINNLETGNFVNAQTNYFSAPQQLNPQGQIIGHSHVVIESIDSVDSTTVSNPNDFAFFLGLNAAAQNGILTANVSNGLPAGTYKLTSINTAANHQPVLVPIAQHGSTEDSVYFTVGAAAKAAAQAVVSGSSSGTSSNTGATAAASSAASSTAAAASTTTSAASGASKSGSGKGSGAQGGSGKGKGKNGRRFIRELF